MRQEPTPDFLKYTLLGIEADYEATVREAKETIRRAEERRDALIARAREWAQGKGGTEVDLLGAPEGDEVLPAEERTSRTNGVASNGPNENGGNVVSKDVVLRFVDEVMNDPTVEVVTQTEIKDRILANHPVSKNYLNSLRILIINPLNELVELGYLELVERGRAGQPNKYRKTGKRAEETGELPLKSGP